MATPTKPTNTRPLRSVARMLYVCVAGVLGGCSTSSLLDSDLPVPVNYVIAPVPPAASPTSSPASQVDLAVGRPDVAPGLDTSRIAVLRGRQLDYYRAVQWGGNTLEVVQSLLVASLQNQQLFRSVTSEQGRVSGAYILDTEVRDFQAEYKDGIDVPTVRVTIIGRIVRIADRALVDSITATASRVARDNRMAEVAEAFEGAAQEVALTIARETAAAVSRDRERMIAIPTQPSPPP